MAESIITFVPSEHSADYRRSVATRIAVYQGHDSGFIDNLELNQKNANDDNSTQERIAVRWIPSSDLIVDASATFAKLDTHGSYVTYSSLGAVQLPVAERRSGSMITSNSTTLPRKAIWLRAIRRRPLPTSDRRFRDQRSFQYIDEALADPRCTVAGQRAQSNNVKDATQENTPRVPI